MACVAAIIALFTLTGCTSAPEPASAPKPLASFNQPTVTVLYPQAGYLGNIEADKNGTLRCLSDDAALTATFGATPKTVSNNGTEVTTSRTADGVSILFAPDNQSTSVGIVDGVRVVSFDNDDGGMYDNVKLVGTDFAPVDKTGEPDPKYKINSVTLCGGGM